MQQLELYKFDDGSHQFSNIRSIIIDDVLYFVAADVARTLGYAKPSNAVSTHCKPKGTLKQGILTAGGMQELTFITEANVYRLISRSQLPSAEKFESWLFEEVVPSIRKKGFYGNIDRSALSNFAERFRDNFHKVDSNYFSVITEMYIRLYSALEGVGYVIPDVGSHKKKMMPDISVGRGFADFLRFNAPEYINTCKTYTHSFPDGRAVEANMYPIDAIPIFIRYINEVWLPTKAQAYFKDRDDLALEFLPKLLQA
ncbi:BRO-N domain-containing protein [Mucilaginibacter sp.]|uniref:BRO-N domain-containing protein n=1 Tax=Mucilaginibacter sp. TaxID=1882438 RepID=UPI003D13E780